MFSGQSIPFSIFWVLHTHPRPYTEASVPESRGVDVSEENGKEVRGFRVLFGGGLGSFPHAAQLLTEFIPADQILLLAETIVRIFNKHGDKKTKITNPIHHKSFPTGTSIANIILTAINNSMTFNSIDIIIF